MPDVPRPDAVPEPDSGTSTPETAAAQMPQEPAPEVPAPQEPEPKEPEPEESSTRAGGLTAVWQALVEHVRGVSRTWWMVGAGALVVVVAVVAVVLVVVSRSSGSTPTNLAADFVDEPALGSQMQVGELLGGQFSRTDVLVFTDTTHALVWGSGPGAVVGSVDLDAHRLDWKLDLGTVTGFDSVMHRSARASGSGSAVLDLVDLSDGSAKTMVVAVSADGKVTGTRDTGMLLDAVDGYAVIMDDTEVLVAATSSFESDVWRAKVHPKAYPDDSTVLVDGKDFYVLATGGYVDGRTGTPVGYGDDIDTAVYQVLPDRVALKVTCTKDGCSAMRFDLKNGKDLWDAELTSLFSRHAMAVVAGTLVVQDFDGVTIRGVKAADGTQLWAQKIADVDYLVGLNSGYVLGVTRGLTPDGQGPSGVVLDPADGRMAMTLDRLWGYPAASGTQVFYTVYDDQLRAFSATGTSDSQLWSLPVPGSNYGAFHAADGRLFVVGRAYLEESVHTSIWEVVAP